MKKIFCLLIIGVFLFSCDKENNKVEKPIVKEQSSINCMNKPPELYMLINEKTEKYKDFFDKDGVADASVGIYDKKGNRIKMDFVYGKRLEHKFKIKNVYAYFNIDYGDMSFFTGKEEVLYIKNKGEDIEVKIKGKRKNIKCGSVVDIEKVAVDGRELKKGKDFGGGRDAEIVLIPKRVNVEKQEGK